MIILHKPSLKLLPSYLNCMNEMAEIGEKVWPATIPLENESNKQFIQRILSEETSLGASEVPEIHYWACIENHVVGRISFRLRLNESLKEFGGHIGYEVRPSFRKQGVATAMLKAILETEQAHSIGKLLLTCSPENIASIKTIIANGGVLKETKFVSRVNRHTNLYWITL